MNQHAVLRLLVQGNVCVCVFAGTCACLFARVCVCVCVLFCTCKADPVIRAASWEEAQASIERVPWFCVVQYVYCWRG